MAEPVTFVLIPRGLRPQMEKVMELYRVLEIEIKRNDNYKIGWALADLQRELKTLEELVKQLP